MGRGRRSLQPVQQFLQGEGIDRFDNVMIESGFLGAAPACAYPKPVKATSTMSLPPGRSPMAPCSIVAVERWQADIHQDDFWIEGGCQFHGFKSVMGGANLVAQDVEHDRQAVRRVLIVVHDQDAATRPGGGGFSLASEGRAELASTAHGQRHAELAAPRQPLAGALQCCRRASRPAASQASDQSQAHPGLARANDRPA